MAGLLSKQNWIVVLIPLTAGTGWLDTGSAVLAQATSQKPSAEAPAPQPSAPPAAAKPPPQPSTTTSAVVMDLSAIESVIGKSVKSSGGEDLGRIIDLLVTTSGQLRAAVIDFGGVLGVGSRKVAVDWKALDFTNLTKDGTIRLALTRDQVRMSPEYKSGDPVVILQGTRPDDAKPPTPVAPAADKTPRPTQEVKAPPPAAASAPQGEAHKP